MLLYVSIVPHGTSFFLSFSNSNDKIATASSSNLDHMYVHGVCFKMKRAKLKF